MSQSNTNSPFFINEKPLTLARYPASGHDKSLQAWDASDEYLVEYIQSLSLSPNSRIAIFNDNFGALSLALSNYQCVSISDSVVAHQGLKQNAKLNEVASSTIQWLSIIEFAEQYQDVESFDLIIIKLPKIKQYLHYQLALISQIANSNTIIIGADKAKDIHSSTLALFEQLLGTTTTSLAKKKARLIFCQAEKQSTLPDPKRWQTDKPKLQLANLANVFSQESLDIGARFFMQHLPQVKAEQQVIDLACGNGVIGLSVLSHTPTVNLHFVDESYMAVASAKQNVMANFAQALAQCQFTANDCLSGFAANSADIILCNPPFHQQQAVTDHIAWQMFNDSFNVLKKGGELRIVGNRQLGYHVKLKRLFGNCQVIASNKKFVVLSAIKS